jgi:hypothetical protein
MSCIIEGTVVGPDSVGRSSLLEPKKYNRVLIDSRDPEEPLITAKETSFGFILLAISGRFLADGLVAVVAAGEGLSPYLRAAAERPHFEGRAGRPMKAVPERKPYTRGSTQMAIHNPSIFDIPMSSAPL